MKVSPDYVPPLLAARHAFSLAHMRSGSRPGSAKAVLRPGSAQLSGSRSTGTIGTIGTIGSSSGIVDPVDVALSALLPDESQRPPPRLAAPAPPRLPFNHPASHAALRAAAVARATAGRPTRPTALAPVRGGGGGGGGSGFGDGGGGGGTSRGAAPLSPAAAQVAAAARATVAAEVIDPGAQRLFVEPKFHAPPPVLTAFEQSAILRRQLGPEGSIGRSIADGRAADLGVMLVADNAAAALRRFGAFRHFSDEALSRLVRLGRMQRRSRYQHFYHEGSRADAIFILVSGTVLLSAGRDQKGGRELKPPAVFGLEALGTLSEGQGEERLEGAMAVRPSVCVSIRSDTLHTSIAELAATLPFFHFEQPSSSSSAQRGEAGGGRAAVV